MLTKGMSQSDVARAVWQETRQDKNGFTQPVGKDRISAYVNGKVLPTEETLKRIADALDTTPEKLLGEGPQAADTSTPSSLSSPRLYDLAFSTAEHGEIIVLEFKYAVQWDEVLDFLRDFTALAKRYQENEKGGVRSHHLINAVG
jgi:transcriptional regulator with XRE-family HTH domain